MIIIFSLIFSYVEHEVRMRSTVNRDGDLR